MSAGATSMKPCSQTLLISTGSSPAADCAVKSRQDSNEAPAKVKEAGMICDGLLIRILVVISKKMA
jgi:hypothetical protein